MQVQNPPPGPRAVNDRVYVFLDESGNLDFSPSGTRYFVLTSVSMRRPFQINGVLDEYKYDCIEYGLGQQYFHCAEDNSHVRGRVFEIIGSHLENMEVHSLIVEKSKTNPVLRVETRFYPQMFRYLLQYVLNSSFHQNADEMIIITDTLPLKRQRRAVEKAVKSNLSEMLPDYAKYKVVHHESRSHHGLQVADYCCWAIHRRWERGDENHYSQIRSAVRSEFDIFQTGTTHYY